MSEGRKGNGRHPNSLKNLRGVSGITHEEAVEAGRKGGLKQGENKRRKKALREIWEEWGESKATKFQRDALRIAGIDATDMNQLEVLAELIKNKSLDTKISLGDLLKVLDTYGKYTKQEPTQKTVMEIKSDGLGVNLNLVKSMEKHFNNGDETD